MMIEPTRRLQLNIAIATARDTFREWSKTTGWPPVNSQPYFDFLAVIDDAVIAGWDAAYAQQQEPDELCQHDWRKSLDGGTLICSKCGGWQ